MRILTKNKARSYACLIAVVAKDKGEERAATCGYDLMRGIVEGDDKKRAAAWAAWLKQPEGAVKIQEQRDGVWVPSIPI
jgi:hypothetical protein